VWQWVHNGVRLPDGTPITAELVRGILAEESERLGPDYAAAAELFERVALAEDFADFLTVPAYRQID
jgi:malate synthase